MIPNHYSAALSILDLKMVRAVPPGGNWKNIPETIPSKRLEQIRRSYAAGEGSRSTYYGRLNPEMPSHTISTYFNRPGNGSFIHYSQDRMISQREAARLQGFRDDFVFLGNKTQINKQIGNAVPPILAYQFARSFGEVGCFIDLFAGAGGLSSGFTSAGWRHVLANDIEKSFLETYAENLGGSVILGDICDYGIREQILSIAKNKGWNSSSQGPRLVLGGPPCQGFSTAGKRRSMSDKRNHLFKEYAHLIEVLRPDAFLFENVLGLRSMEGGQVLSLIVRSLERVGYSTQVCTVRADDYGVPQRRGRVIIIGSRAGSVEWKLPEPVSKIPTVDQPEFDLMPPCPTVLEALDDLPVIAPGEDGSHLGYVNAAATPYQELARGKIDISEYLSNLKKSSSTRWMFRTRTRSSQRLI